MQETQRNPITKLLTDQWMKRIVLAFFVVYFALGCLLFRDYGVSTDEIFQIDKARITLDYVFGRNDALLTYPDRHYGAIFPILLDLGGWFFSDSRDIFLYRHFITFLFFYFSTILFYLILRKLEYSRLLSLTGTAFLILHPHIFGHSFYNPKDIPFLAMWILAMYTLATVIKSGARTRSLLWHGLVSGLLVVFRLPGVLMWGISGLMLGWMWISGQFHFRQLAAKLFVFMAVSIATLYVFLPALWLNPINEFITFLSMSPFDWAGKELLLGQFYDLADIPWYHLPVYIAVTMPLVFLGLFGLAIIFLPIQLFRQKNGFHPNSAGPVFALDSAGFSLLVLFIGRPAIYNGWRHVLFLYPMILLVVVEFVNQLWHLEFSPLKPFIGKILRIGIAISLVGQSVVLISFMIDSHPYEYTYYNWLTGRKLSGTRISYIMDYWGLAYREAFERLLERDTSPLIVVTAENYVVASQNLLILPVELRNRIRLEKIDTGIPEDYYITGFREFLPIER